MKKIAVFASGHGTNFEAIDDNIKKGYLDASIELLVVDQKKAEVIDKAKKRGVETLVLSPKDFNSKKEYEECILERLKEKGSALSVTALPCQLPRRGSHIGCDASVSPGRGRGP